MHLLELGAHHEQAELFVARVHSRRLARDAVRVVEPPAGVDHLAPALRQRLGRGGLGDPHELGVADGVQAEVARQRSRVGGRWRVARGGRLRRRVRLLGDGHCAGREEGRLRRRTRLFGWRRRRVRGPPPPSRRPRLRPAADQARHGAKEAAAVGVWRTAARRRGVLGSSKGERELLETRPEEGRLVARLALPLDRLCEPRLAHLARLLLPLRGERCLVTPVAHRCLQLDLARGGSGSLLGLRPLQRRVPLLRLSQRGRQLRELSRQCRLLASRLARELRVELGQLRLAGRPGGGRFFGALGGSGPLLLLPPLHARLALKRRLPSQADGPAGGRALCLLLRLERRNLPLALLLLLAQRGPAPQAAAREQSASGGLDDGDQPGQPRLALGLAVRRDARAQEDLRVPERRGLVRHVKRAQDGGARPALPRGRRVSLRRRPSRRVRRQLRRRNHRAVGADKVSYGHPVGEATRKDTHRLEDAAAPELPHHHRLLEAARRLAHVRLDAAHKVRRRAAYHPQQLVELCGVTADHTAETSTAAFARLRRGRLLREERCDEGLA
mmetsp:Transcript_25757/g.85844  ORF Transcript_25757/g.85844 Transcript_25757/m.85844 type:complete len:557 (+) Transcript_25757:925-2595(+)